MQTLFLLLLLLLFLGQDVGYFFVIRLLIAGCHPPVRVFLLSVVIVLVVIVFLNDASLIQGGSFGRARRRRCLSFVGRWNESFCALRCGRRNGIISCVAALLLLTPATAADAAGMMGCPRWHREIGIDVDELSMSGVLRALMTLFAIFTALTPILILSA